MIAYTTSAQAILRAKIARLEQLLTELEQHHRDMRTILVAVVKLEIKEQELRHDT